MPICKDDQHDFVISPKEERIKGHRPKIVMYYKCRRCGLLKKRDGVVWLNGNPMTKEGK